MAKLGTDDRRALHTAMREAFPTYPDLEMFVQHHLGESLPAIVARCGSDEAVHERLKWVEARGSMDALLGALAEARRDHPAVATLTERLGADNEFPLASLPRVQRFLGRDAERDALAAHIVAGDGAAVRLRGPPGAGKSILALAVLNEPRVAARFRGRRWFVRLDGARSGAAVWGEIRQAMGLPLGP